MMLNRFNQKLSELMRVLPFDSSISVFFNDKQLVTSGDGTRQLSLFYDKLKQESPDFTCDCLHLDEQASSFQIYDRFLMFVYPIRNAGSIFVKIDRTKLEQSLEKSSQVFNNVVHITTEKGEVVAVSQSFPLSVNVQQLKDGQPVVIEGKRFTPIHIAMNGLQYTILYAESNLQQKIRKVNVFTLTTFLAFFLIAFGLLAANITLYRPIKSTISKLLSSTQLMKRTLDQQQTIMDQNALLRYATASPDDSIPDIDSKLRSKYRNGYILTCYFEEAKNGAKTTIANEMFGQLLADHYSFHKLLHRADADTYFLYNTPPDGITGTLTPILDHLSSKGYFVLCGVSAYIRDIAHIHNALQQSMRAIDNYSFNWGASYHIAEYHGKPTNGLHAPVALSIEKEQELIAYVLKGNQDSLKDFFSCTIYSLVKKMTYRESFGLFRYLNDLMNVIAASKKVNHHDSESIYSDISMIRNPELAYEELVRKYDSLTAHASVQDLSLYEKIVEFIDKNYNSDLSLTYIADRFSITSVYLSSYFKKHSGYNISYYIMLVRIKAALAQFRQNHHLTIKEIGERVGYSSEKTFTRHFKKINGTTPSQYLKFISEES
ncbi:helix-turn-helix domain-containing protein [Paenibacillus chungangensis]|uniref:Helix-turn-helix domain-containing protein n=1 Tax=Paenibacillus chungangensis TaxID=696535 RepID=A0ABW3HU49_9BACL